MKSIRLHIFLFQVALVSFLLPSCKHVYFEKPQPSDGTQVNRIPAGWVGVYEGIDSKDEQNSVYDKQLHTIYRMEALSDSKLLVSVENRVSQNDFPKLKKALEKAQKNEEIRNLIVTEQFIMFDALIKNDSASYWESQYSSLIKDGSWYVFGHSKAPYQILDFAAGTQQSFEPVTNAHLQSELFAGADSFSVKTVKMIPLSKGNVTYLNLEVEYRTYWDWLRIERTSDGNLAVTTSNLEDEDSFTKKLDYFNGITPFVTTDNKNYTVNPTPQALEKLMAEPELFHAMQMKRL